MYFEALYPPETRKNEIATLLGFINQGTSCQLIALPGVGRSTVCGLLAYNRSVRTLHLGNRQTLYHFVLVNYAEIQNLQDSTKFLFITLVDSLRERAFTTAYEKVKSLLTEALQHNDELLFLQNLKHAVEILTTEEALTIVYLLDRFEHAIPTLTPTFFTNLRTLRNHAKYRFSVVFALTRPLEDMVEPTLLTEFYDFVVGNHVYLPMADETGLAFRIRHIEEKTGKKLPESVKKEIITLSGGCTRLVKLMTEVYFEHTPPDKLPDFLSQRIIQRPLFEIWHALTPEEQTIVRSNQSVSGNSYLANVDLVHGTTLSIPLFTPFLKQFVPQQHNEQITYTGETKEIKKGATVLSDTLTALEFKLLFFLLQHAGQVLERDEIIGAVWNETATTAGVSDQALDQLIFRLRKKIETDANNPRHIQTVKGRGLKFTP